MLDKIDEMLAWEQRKETERDTKFVELGRYLCEVRAGQYWRVENVKSFDEFLLRGFRSRGGKPTTWRARAGYLCLIPDFDQEEARTAPIPKPPNRTPSSTRRGIPPRQRDVPRTTSQSTFYGHDSTP